MKNKKGFLEWMWKGEYRITLLIGLIGLFTFIFELVYFFGEKGSMIGLIPAVGVIASTWICFYLPYLQFKKTKNMKKIILAGASGSGKDFLRDAFKDAGYTVDVSKTTRPMRDGEIDGKTYNFITESEFKSGITKQVFYEAVKFNGAHYGTTKDSWNNSDIFIMTPSGIGQIPYEERKNCIVVYLNINEAVRIARMTKRLDNSFDKIERRLKVDKVDFTGFTKQCDLIITNPHFDAEHIIEWITIIAREE